MNIHEAVVAANCCICLAVAGRQKTGISVRQEAPAQLNVFGTPPTG